MIQGNKDSMRTNGEGYVDTTAYEAMERAEKSQQDRRHEAKKYLWQYLRLTEHVQDMEHDLEDLREVSASLSVNLDGMPRGTDISDRTGNAAVKLADLSALITDEKVKREEKRWEIMGVITKVKEPVLYRILRKRYIDFETGDYGRKRLKSWVKIAAEMDFEDMRYMYRKHNQALDEVAKILQRYH